MRLHRLCSGGPQLVFFAGAFALNAAIAALVVLRPQSVIGSVFSKMKDGKFTDEASMKFLTAGIDDLLRDIAKTQVVIKQES